MSPRRKVVSEAVTWLTVQAAGSHVKLAGEQTHVSSSGSDVFKVKPTFVNALKYKGVTGKTSPYCPVLLDGDVIQIARLSIPYGDIRAKISLLSSKYIPCLNNSSI